MTDPALPLNLSPRWTSRNPAVQRWGLGPAGARCGTCAHLFCNWSNARKKFYKCAKRGEVEGISAGPRTDHRVRWEACKKYEPDPAESGNSMEAKA